MDNNKLKEDTDKQFVITLALIQKAIEDLTIRTEHHNEVLFGNGKPEDSIVWSIRMLQKTVEQVEGQLKAMCGKCEDRLKELQSTYTTEYKTFIQKTALANEQSDQPWRVIFKKIITKSPWILLIAFIIVLIHKPAMVILLGIFKLFGV